MDCVALVKLYENTDGPNWRLRSGWLEDNNPCRWYGIQCENNRVTHIFLSNNGLTGTLPEELGRLEHLRALSIPVNSLTGEIPTSLGQIQKLELLRLNKNQLSSEIPSELGQLNRLTTFDLSNNHLHGEIPIELSQLTNLQTFDVSSNRLRGFVPEEVACQKTLQTLGSSLNMNFNQLQSENDAAATCLSNRNRNWLETQTLAPTDLQVTQHLTTELTFAWTPILYTEHGGYYEIGLSVDGGSTYTIMGQTESKLDSSLTIPVRVAPNGEFLFTVRSFTPSHPNQKNDLISEYSSPIAITVNTEDDTEVDTENDGG